MGESWVKALAGACHMVGAERGFSPSPALLTQLELKA